MSSMRITLIAVVLAVAVSALPEDTAVPEAELGASAAMYTPAAAHKEATAIMETMFAQQGEKKGGNACKDLAKATEKEVTTASNTAQKLLKLVDNGKKCKDAGQAEVKAAKSQKDKAEKKSKAANDAYTKSTQQKITWTFDFGSVTEGQCGSFFNAPQWKSAKAKVSTAKKVKEQAAGELKASIASIKAMETSAKEQAGKCACKAMASVKKATEVSNSKLVSANTKAWTKAAHLLCVLDGKTTEQCKVTAIPKVKQPQMAPGVEKMCKSLMVAQGVASELFERHLQIHDIKNAGWTQCYTKRYNHASMINDIKKQCSGTQLLQGCGTAGGSTLRVAASGLKKDMFQDCSQWSNQLYNVVGPVGWYCGPAGKSFGFIKAKDTNIVLNSCAGIPGGVCIHTDSTGYSCDGTTGSGNDQLWIFQRN